MSNRILVLAGFLLVFHVSVNADPTWVPLKGEKTQASGITQTRNGQSSTTLRMHFSGFSLEEIVVQGSRYSIPLLDNSFSLFEKGSPELPVLSTTVALNPAGTPHAAVVSSTYQDFENILIAPSAGDKQGVPVPADRNFGPVYQQNSFFPGDLLNQDEPFLVRCQRGISIQIFPFQYNPVTHILRVYYDLEIEVAESGEPGINEASAEDLRLQPIREMQIASAGSANSLKAGTLQSEEGCMLIISPAEFMKALKPLAEWKNRSGIPTEIIDAGSFSSSESLKEFIRNYYYSKGNLAYLLLAGDADQLPTFMLPQGASDNSYAYLSGTDHYPDIFVGRFSAATSNDIEIQVKRSLEYDQNPYTGSDWFTHSLGIASTLGPGDDNETDYAHVRKLLSTLNDFSYEAGAELFDGSEGGKDAEGAPTSRMIIDEVNEGKSIVLYSGHGSTSEWVTGKFQKSDVSSLDNKGMYPFVISAACENGNFSGSFCLAEAWMRARTSGEEPAGAIAALMASAKQPSFPPMHAQDVIVENIGRSGAADGKQSIGGITASGLFAMNDAYGAFGKACTDTWILFGDPSVKMRTCHPQTLQVSVSKTVDNEFVISSSALNGKATLSENGKILCSAPIQNGTGTLFIQQVPGANTIDLVVTAFNAIPFIATLNVKTGLLTQVLPVTPAKEDPSYKIYPNPITSQFSIEAIHGTSQITNIRLVSCTSGSVAWNSDQETTLSGKTGFEIPSIPNGYYILVIQNESGDISTNRVLVNK